MFRLRGVMLLGICIFLNASSVFAQAPSELDKLKDAADTAYRDRDFPKAMQLCDQVLAKDPQDHVALYLRGSSRIEMGIFSGKTDLIVSGIADSREAIRHEGNGKPEYYLPYIYGMSHLSAHEGKPVHATTARTVADSILDKEGLTAEQRANLYYQRAQADLQLKDFPEARKDLQEAIKLQPQHLAAHMLLAESAAAANMPAEAVADYNRVVATFSTNPLVYNNRGMYLQSIGKTKEALADFDRAIQLDPKFVPTYVNRGFALLESGDAASAEAALTQALAMDPSQLGAVSLRATARLDQFKAAEAIADYRQVVQKAPENPMAYADLGFALFFTKDYSGALDSFRTALRLNPNLRFLLQWQLACEKRLNQVNAANYQASTTKAADQLDWVDQVVLFQLSKSDTKQLLAAVSKVDKNAQASQMAEAYYFIGVELQRLNREDDAKAYFKQATVNKLPKLSAYRGSVYALGAP
ncbi:tetratricopeptide repeat protein [Planctomicrobium sp. SH668]|uniref:tetratricopeptide repeat protein n=1 Tax=Planctomicrobium sp. SH668 TaxID=3448126 RepID=UPI003F5BFF62